MLEVLVNRPQRIGSVFIEPGARREPVKISNTFNFVYQNCAVPQRASLVLNHGFSGENGSNERSTSGSDHPNEYLRKQSTSIGQGHRNGSAESESKHWGEHLLGRSTSIRLPQGNGSVISRSASIKHKDGIKKRNKIGNKEIEGDSEGKQKKKQPFSFIFPVKRRTSLKAPKRNRPNFTTEDELTEFIRHASISGSDDLLPIRRALYKYSYLFLLHPLLRKKLVEREKLTNTYELSSKKGVAAAISGPLHETATKNNQIMDPEAKKEERDSFLDRVYSRYHDAIFEKKGFTVPRFYQIFPEERKLALLRRREVNRFDRTILFEILLRRTLAAKINFRLRSSHYNFQNNLESGNVSSLSSWESRDSGYVMDTEQ